MIAIKDMEMPSCCNECPMYQSEDSDYCDITGEWITGEEMGRHNKCPLTEIITCKDCKYCEEVHYEDESEPPYIKLKCNSTRNTRFYRVEEDFYCGDGERRE